MRTLSRDQIRDVAEHILKVAVQRSLPAGGQLDTERSLSEALGVTRSAVRSALALLESEEIVSREVGRGTYLRCDPLSAIVTLDGDAPSALAMLHEIGPFDVMAARQAFEPMAMYVAVLEATEADFEEVARCVELGAHTSDYDEFETCDLAFHRSLIEATHNPLMLKMYGLVEAARQGDLWGSMKRRGDTPQRRHGSYLQHVAVYEAFRNRDGRGAHEAMADHLESVTAFLRENARR